MREQLEKYFQSKNLEYKFSSDKKEIILKVCPFCQDKKFHLYFSAELGVFHCKKCDMRGNLYTFKKQLGDISIKSLKDLIPEKEVDFTQKAITYSEQLPPKVIEEYLKAKRHLTEEIIKEYKIGYCIMQGKEWISIPYFRKGKCVNIKYRTIPPEKQFMSEEGGKVCLFNIEKALEELDLYEKAKAEWDKLPKEEKQKTEPPKKPQVYVVESELDAILMEQLQDFPVVATGGLSIPEEELSLLLFFDRIIFVFDTDIPGIEGMHKLARKLNYQKCFYIELPDKDPCDSLEAVGGNVSKLFTYFSEEHPLLPKSIKTLPEIIDKLLSGEEQKGIIKIPWDNLSTIAGELTEGQVILLSGSPKMGKTTLALNLAWLNSLDIPVLFYCLEMQPEDLVKRILKMENITLEELPKKKDRLLKHNILFGFTPKATNFDEVKELIQIAVNNFDTQFVVFDNVHFLVRRHARVSQELSVISKEFKLMAMEMGILIMLIAQPRKLEKEDEMTYNDIRDTSAFASDCDQIWLMYRKRQGNWEGDVYGSFEDKTRIRIDASRTSPGGECYLRFIPERFSFEVYVEEEEEKGEQLPLEKGGKNGKEGK